MQLNSALRPTVWRLLLGGAAESDYHGSVSRSRSEYAQACEPHFSDEAAVGDTWTHQCWEMRGTEHVRELVVRSSSDVGEGGVNQPTNCTEEQATSWSHILKDSSRTPDSECSTVQQCVARGVQMRILFMAASRFNYVAGMNCMLSPFLLIFLTGALQLADPAHLMAAEADAYYCFTQFLERLGRDRYSYSNYSDCLKREKAQLAALVDQLDPQLSAHLQDSCEFPLFQPQIGFLLDMRPGWLSTLFAFNMSPEDTVLLWDSYLAFDASVPELNVCIFEGETWLNTGRWIVLLDNGTKMKLKPANLEE